MVPTKRDPDSAGGEAISGLIAMINSCDEFKADFNKVAQELGISHGKNAPRKIDSLIKPYGFAFKSGKIVKVDGAGNTPATPETPSSKSKKLATTGASEADSDEKSATTKKTPKTPKSASPAKKAPAKENAISTPRGKKRKIQELKENSDTDEAENGKDEHSEATKLIKEKMGDGGGDEEMNEVNEDPEA